MIRYRRNKVEGLHVAGDVWCTNGEIRKREALNSQVTILRMLTRI